MAVQEDYDMCNIAWRQWAETQEPSWVITCSANIRQMKLLRDIIPGASITNFGQETWNLDEACPKPRADVIVACNVFHYAQQPWIWFKNILTSCKYFWMQDLFARRRGIGDDELGPTDGDWMRYGLGGVFTNYAPHVFDLSEHQSRLLDYRVYDAGSFREGKTLINFVACFRGDLK